MSQKIIFSSAPDGATYWQKGPNTNGLQKLGVLPLTGVEIYQGNSLEKAQKLSVMPESEELTRAVCEFVAESFGRMPRESDLFSFHRMNLTPFQASDLRADVEQEWVFYGGSFNPWHEGHRACLDLMPKGPKLVVVPDRNPWKDNTNSLSWPEFWELTLRVHDSGHSLYPGFFLMNQANPTVDWLSQVEGKKSLLVGDDNLCQIKKWKDHEKLLSCLTCLYVAPRKLTPELHSLVQESLDYVESFGVGVHRLGHHEYEHLSSTEIRAKKRPS